MRSFRRLTPMLIYTPLMLWLAGCSSTHETRDWERLPAISAQDVGVGGDGSAWAVYDENAGCRCVLRLNGSAWKTYALPRSARRVAVDPIGMAWVATVDGDIYRFNGSAFEPFPGPTAPPYGDARDIAVSGKNTVWLVGRRPSGNGFKIHRYEGGSWTTVPGEAVRIAANGEGKVWILNSANQGLQFNGTSFVRRFTGEVPLNDIGVGPDGTVWVSSRKGTFLWNGFVLKERGNLVSLGISVGPPRAAWAVNWSGVYRWTGPLSSAEE